jgi:hypothetical protein
MPNSISTALPAGGVPDSFAVNAGYSPVPNSEFVSALPHSVVFTGWTDANSPSGNLLIVDWRDPASGREGQLKAGDWGFPQGQAEAFAQCLEAAVKQQSIVFVGGARSRLRTFGGKPRGLLAGWFCAFRMGSPFPSPTGSSQGASSANGQRSRFGRS